MIISLNTWGDRENPAQFVSELRIRTNGFATLYCLGPCVWDKALGPGEYSKLLHQYSSNYLPPYYFSTHDRFFVIYSPKISLKGPIVEYWKR